MFAFVLLFGLMTLFLKCENRHLLFPGRQLCSASEDIEERHHRKCFIQVVPRVPFTSFLPLLTCHIIRFITNLPTHTSLRKGHGPYLGCTHVRHGLWDGKCVIQVDPRVPFLSCLFLTCHNIRFVKMTFEHPDTLSAFSTSHQRPPLGVPSTLSKTATSSPSTWRRGCCPWMSLRKN